MTDKIHDIVLNDRRLKVREIGETVNISVGCVWYTLHECLGKRKLSARWVPRLLTADHKNGLVWLRLRMCTGPGKTHFPPWFCFNNDKLNTTDYKKFSNPRINLNPCIRTDIRWYSFRVVTYLR